MQEAKINLGKVVRVARKRKRITQDYLAEKGRGSATNDSGNREWQGKPPF